MINLVNIIASVIAALILSVVLKYMGYTLNLFEFQVIYGILYEVKDLRKDLTEVSTQVE